MLKSLKDIRVQDTADAKTPNGIPPTLAPGEYDAKILQFVEEDNYNYISMEIAKKRYNMFYDYYLRDSTDLNKEVLDWLKALATIPVKNDTTMLEIANSAIGSTYKITVYNYTSKSGKNKGNAQHAISFRDLPVLQETLIETEEAELPF